MKDNSEYSEEAGADGRQGVVLLLGCWAGRLKLPTVKKRAFYKMLRMASDLDGFFVETSATGNEREIWNLECESISRVH
jgi:hypothetical protein